MNNGNIIWKPIAGFEGYYEISNSGLIRSNDRAIKVTGGKTRQIKSMILKPRNNGLGYLFAHLSKNNNAKRYYVHRLVAEAFIPNPERLPEVNHRSGIKSDNTVDNLEWVCHKENCVHAYKTGLNHRATIGVIDNYLHRKFASVNDWCDARGVKHSTGRNILNGCNKSKIIDLSQVVLMRPSKTK